MFVKVIYKDGRIDRIDANAVTTQGDKIVVLKDTTKVAVFNEQDIKGAFVYTYPVSRL